MTTIVHDEQRGHAGGTSPPAMVPVWDVFVRIFHWSLVASFAIAFVTADEIDRLHELTGYVAVGLVAARILWGFVGTRHARFTDFVKSPFTVIAHLFAMLAGRERRYIGHNPAGGMMILALLAGILTLGVTGWMMTEDAYWADEWLEDVHEAVANGMLVLIALHVLGVIVESLRHGENLVLAMVTGKKRRPD